MEKITQEKELYLAENRRMAGELLEIKKLMESALAQA